MTPQEEEAKLHDELRIATRAGHELELTSGYFQQLEQDYIKAWRDTSLSQERERERLWQAVQIVGKVRSHLKTLADNRKVVERQIAEITKLGAKRFLGIV